MCGCGSANKSIKKRQPQTVSRSSTGASRSIVKKSIKPANSDKPQQVKRTGGVSLSRQKLVRHDKCPKCGDQIILVNIAGKERNQCISCKKIV